MSEAVKPYIVLANKYRPKDFSTLIGQEILVTTLSNAITTNRIANAFLLTGIRGVGKTTTARIVAKVLNCIGEDGKGGPTPTPCGKCANCLAIAEDRHTDVIEVDAASRTGVDDIREIIDNCNYKPASARYKIYIIDEVHMLSKNAFNALLKTLEEPPAHVKFIFATTEIRKIPITILSRCQRFDLRRIEVAQMAEHLGNIAKQEDAQIDDEALRLIANASEGSVRDALSLLDKAISLSEGKITGDSVHEMLGLADYDKIIDLFSTFYKGDIKQALEIFEDLYSSGIEPSLLIEDLMEFNHLLTRIKVTPDFEITNIAKNHADRAKEIANDLGVSYLSRSWQMLQKGLGELKTAHNSYISTEMIIIRLIHMANFPAPATIIEQIRKGQISNEPSANDIAADHNPRPNDHNTPAPRATRTSSMGGNSVQAQANINIETSNNPDSETVILFNNYNEMVEYFKEKGEILLYTWFVNEVSIIKFSNGVLEFNPSSTVPTDFAGRVRGCLNKWTGQNWNVSVSNIQGEKTIAQQKLDAEQAEKDKIAQDPNVSKILQMFPGSSISKIEPIQEGKNNNEDQLGD